MERCISNGPTISVVGETYLTTIPNLLTPRASFNTNDFTLTRTPLTIRIFAWIAIRLTRMNSTNPNSLLRPQKAIMTALFQLQQIQFTD